MKKCLPNKRSIGKSCLQCSRNAYEYAVREDILASLENNELEDSQARALLKYARPLSLVYKEYDNRVNEYMEDIWNTIESAANQKIQAQKDRKQPER